MALDCAAPQTVERGRAPSRPLSASLRWGLGWTAVVVTLGATAGCVSATPVDDPPVIDDSSDSYAACVAELGGSPDAIEHHINACEVAAAARAFSS